MTICKRGHIEPLQFLLICEIKFNLIRVWLSISKTSAKGWQEDLKLDRGQTTVSADFRNPKDADPCVGREDYHEGSQKIVDSRTSEQTQVEPEKKDDLSTMGKKSEDV